MSPTFHSRKLARFLLLPVTAAGCSKGNHGNCLSHQFSATVAAAPPSLLPAGPVTMDMTMWSMCKPHHCVLECIHVCWVTVY